MIKYISTYLLLLFPLFVFCQENNNNLTIGDFEQILDSTGFVSSQIDTILSSELQEADTLMVKPAPVIEAPIDYSAEDSVILSLDGQKVFLYNKAKVTYQKIELTAYYIEIDLETRQLYAEGILDSTETLTQKPIFKDGAEEFESETIHYNFKTGKGITTKMVLKQGEGFIHSERTKRISSDAFLIAKGKYTVCDADDPHFYMHLSKAKVIPNKKIVTGPSYMVLEDFPIYFPILPFGFFPVTTTYASGVIIPTYGEEVNRGFYLMNGGFYWAANDYFDVGVLGSIYSKGSWDGKFNTNYRKRYKYSGSFNFTYAKNKYGEKWLNTLSVQKQFAVIWSHSQDAKANPGQTFSASVNFSTSGFDKQNATTLDNYLTTSKSSSITFNKKFENTPFNTSVSLRHSQNSRDTTINLTLPELTFNMAKVYPFKSKKQVGTGKWYQDFGITYTGNMQNTISAKEYEVLKKSLIDDWGNGIRHTIPIALPGFKLLNYFNFSPGISYNEKWYFKKYSFEYKPGEPANAKAGSPQNVLAKTIRGLNRVYDYSFNLNMSTSVYGSYMPLNTKSRISSIRHKMSPSIGFSYKPDFGASRYGYWQPVQVDSTGRVQYLDVNKGGVYSASPVQGASGSINFSLSNSVEMKVLDAPRGSSRQAQADGEGNETDSKASADKYRKVKIIDDISLSTSYDLIRDTLKLSDININARTTIKGVNVSAGGTLSPYMVNENGVTINKFTWNERSGIGKLGRLRRAQLSFGMQFRSKQGRNAADANKARIEGADKTLPGSYSDYADFNVPWDFSYDYSFAYTGPQRPGDKGRITQTLGMRGNLSLTEKWRMSMDTNFDIMARQFSYTQFNVTRDLHCWQMTFNFVPFGYRKSYSFVINARSSILRDLKLTKNRNFMDNHM